MTSALYKYSGGCVDVKGDKGRQGAPLRRPEGPLLPCDRHTIAQRKIEPKQNFARGTRAYGIICQ